MVEVPPNPQWPSQACGPLRHSLSLWQFSQQEEKRQKSERLQQQQKHENQMRDMMAQCESNMSELQQLQVPPSLPPLLGLPQFPSKKFPSREGNSLLVSLRDQKLQTGKESPERSRG